MCARSRSVGLSGARHGQSVTAGRTWPHARSPDDYLCYWRAVEERSEVLRQAAAAERRVPCTDPFVSRSHTYAEGKAEKGHLNY